MQAAKASDIKRQWCQVDAKDQILGRLASRIAEILMGKQKPYFVRNLDCGDYVVVINAEKVKVTGQKETDKKYYHHSGYPGGLKTTTLDKLRQKDCTQLIRHAVWGMVPHNKLGQVIIKKLHVYAGEENPHQNKIKIKKDLPAGR